MPKIRRTSQRLAAQGAKFLGTGKRNTLAKAKTRSKHEPPVESTSSSSLSVQPTHESSVPLDSPTNTSNALVSSSVEEGSSNDTLYGRSRSLVLKFRGLCEEAVSGELSELHKKDAEQMKKYMRNKFSFFGIKAPQRRRFQKELIEGNSEILKDRDTLFSFLGLLWDQDEREFQAFGVDFCHQFRAELLGSSDEEFRQAVSNVQACITCKSWWDTVDGLSYPVIGYFVKERPLLGVPLMQQWIDHDNMWLRRVAILHQLSQKSDTDQTRLFSMCLLQAHEKEFFIRKAIGWALREYFKTNKEAVREFVDANREALSGLSVREALKYC